MEDNLKDEKRNLGDDFFKEDHSKPDEYKEHNEPVNKPVKEFVKESTKEPISTTKEPVKTVKNKNKNYWKLFSLMLVVALLAVTVFDDYNPYSTKDGAALSKDEAAFKALDLINTNFLQGRMVAELTDVEESGDVYKMSLNIDGQETFGYITKDGTLFFPQVIELDQAQLPLEQQQSPAEIIKSDKPVVEVFVMSHCPYGTQIEKGMLPVAYLLGDKIDFNLKFVSYAMHGEREVAEQLIQHCIQEEQNDKFLDYLKCFLEDGDGEGCLTDTGIDFNLLGACVAAVDGEFGVTANLEDRSLWLNGQYPQFNVHKVENDLYGVRGSPALVINGGTVSAGRDSVSLLNAICDAFNVAPEECNTQLESTAPSPGFGWSGSGSNNIASCGG